jgi:hypothetical protein
MANCHEATHQCTAQLVSVLLIGDHTLPQQNVDQDFLSHDLAREVLECGWSVHGFISSRLIRIMVLVRVSSILSVHLTKTAAGSFLRVRQPHAVAHGTVL